MSATVRRSRGARSAGSSALATVLLGTAVAVACGGESDTPFHDPLGTGGEAASGSGGKGLTGGSAGAGAAGGASGGTGGSGGVAATGGNAGTSGGAGGSGTGGSAAGIGGQSAAGGTGGTAGEAGGTGGSAGEAPLGGAGGTMGGSAGDGTGGSSGATTGGSAGMGAASGTGGGDGSGAAAGSGGTSGKGGSGAAGKGGKSGCDELQATARELLIEAQVCNLAAGGRQCTGTVEDLCGCEVPVNHEESTETEKYLAALAAAKECNIACPAVVCVAPEAATCGVSTGGSISGRCRAFGLATP